VVLAFLHRRDRARRVADRRASLRALAQAEELYVPPSPHDPAWLGFLGRGFLLEDRAACQLRIGQPTQALVTLEEAERLARPGRLQRQAVILAYRAGGLVRAGQLADGCQAARDALEIAMPIGYRRVLTDIATLRRLRLHKLSRTPAVKDLDELLRLAGALR
jgi:hypothetical protein